jgi:hypothetical protein
MNESFNISNPNTYFALASAIAAIGLYLINRKTFKLLYEKPRIEIERISTTPNQYVGPPKDRMRCKIRMWLINPSSNKNLISITLKRPLSSTVLKKIDDHELEGLTKSVVNIDPDANKIEHLKNRWLILIVKDIRGKKTRKWFRFKDTK